MATTKIHENPQRGLWSAIRSVFRADAAKAADSAVREAAGATVDADDDQWRKLTGDAQRDLSPITQARMQKLAHYQWETNLLANRLIELPLAYLLSQGVEWKVDDENAQAALDRHWADGINNWDIKLTKKVRELALFGEQIYPAFRDVNTGRVRLGYLDPSLVETVVTDPDNIEQPIGIVTKRNKKGEARRFRIIVNVPETAFTGRTQAIRESFDDGECFFFRVNELSASSRGRSDLLAQIDWLDAYDQFLFGELDRASFLRAFVWDVTMTGATPEEVTARAKSISAPKPGSVRVHNEQEAWEPKSPSLQAADAAEGARLFRNHVLGGGTIPEHWYGGGGDVNRATGESMSEPTEKMLVMRRRYVGYMLAEIGRYVIRSAWGKLDAEVSDAEADILTSVRAEWPEMSAKDTSRYAAALQQVAVAVASLLQDALITRKTAVALIAQMADRLGVTIDDPEAELEAASEDLAANGGASLFGMPLRDQPAPAPAPDPAGA